MVILKCGHGIGITPKQKDRPARLLLVNGLELYSVLLAALERSAMRFDLRREPQKDSCKAAQGKCSFPWDGIGLAHKRQLRFHRAVCKTVIFTQRGLRKSIEDDFMGKRRNCGVNEHLCFLHRCERYAASDDKVYNCALFHRGFGTLLRS